MPAVKFFTFLDLKRKYSLFKTPINDPGKRSEDLQNMSHHAKYLRRATPPCNAFRRRKRGGNSS
jgi:hypothetical protein